jgi:hypothetical protein
MKPTIVVLILLTSIRSKILSKDISLSNWMNQPVVKNKTLKEITLPGTHDSGSYSIGGKLIEGMKFLV